MTTSTWYRKGVFWLKGSKEYTKTGYESASTKFDAKDLEVDCSDRHFMITGANSGLGLITAIEIAKRGGILHLVCRNATSMKEARSHIITTTGNDRIFQHQVNLAKPGEVAKWAKEFAESNGKLDVIIHNAGVLLNEREVDEDNLETMFATNVLAVHLITLILLPVLRRSNDPRVIIVSSAGMLTVKLNSNDLNFEKMDPFIGPSAYSQTKRQQVVMNFAYAQRYDRVMFYSMHPGWADTPGVQKSLPEFYEQMKDKLRTPLQGADTIIWLAVSQAALKHSSGLFFKDRAPTTTHLPLAWTRTSNAEEQHFMTTLDKLFVEYSSMDPSHISKSTGRPDRMEMNGEQESILHHPSEPDHEVTSQLNNMQIGERAESLFPVDDKILEDEYNNYEQSTSDNNHVPEKIFDDNDKKEFHETESEFTESSQFENDSQRKEYDSLFVKNCKSQTESDLHCEEMDSPLASEDSLPHGSNHYNDQSSLAESNSNYSDLGIPMAIGIKVIMAEEALNYDSNETSKPSNSETPQLQNASS